MIVTIGWLRWDFWGYRVVTWVTSNISVPSTHLVNKALEPLLLTWWNQYLIYACLNFVYWYEFCLNIWKNVWGPNVRWGKYINLESSQCVQALALSKIVDFPLYFPWTFPLAIACITDVQISFCEKDWPPGLAIQRHYNIEIDGCNSKWIHTTFRQHNFAIWNWVFQNKTNSSFLYFLHFIYTSLTCESGQWLKCDDIKLL